MPAVLTDEAIECVLAAADRSCARGLREFAVLQLSARLALRASDVLALRLEDLHWEHGEILVRGKGDQLDRLPLLQEVGEAIVQYLREPGGGSELRSLFLSHTAPRMGPARPRHDQRDCASRPGACRAAPERSRRCPHLPLLPRHAAAAPRCLVERNRSGLTSPPHRDDPRVRQGRSQGTAMHCPSLTGHEGGAMTDRQAALGEYLHKRRALGTQLKWQDSCLRQFVDFLIAQGTDVVTIALALRWTFRPVGLQPATYGAGSGSCPRPRAACWRAIRAPRFRHRACYRHRTAGRRPTNATQRSWR